MELAAGFLGIVMCLFIGGLISRVGSEEFKNLASKTVGYLAILFIFLGGYFNSDSIFDISGFLFGVIFFSLIGSFMTVYQIGEAILLFAGVIEPTNWPNFFIEGPKAFFSLG